MTASPRRATINFNRLLLSGTGVVNLGCGSLTVNDTISGITGGSSPPRTSTLAKAVRGNYTQSGGTSDISGNLYLGYYAADSGTYNLSGSGLLLVSGTEYAGYHGGFMQTGGENTVACLSVSTDARYLLGGGTVQIVNGGLVNAGVFNGGNSPGTLIANGIVNMTIGTWKNLGSTSVSMSSNGLLILSAGFSAFGSYSSLGLTYTTGSTFMVPAGRSF